MRAESALEGAVGSVPDVVLRRARSADVPQMLELVRVALGEGSIPRTEAFWRWKHEQNPFGPSPAMVADAEGRIVSLRVFLRWRWRYGDRTLAAVRPVDTATHPDWRRRGLFERLTRELVDAIRAEGVAFLFNTPNARSGQGYRKLGWRILGRPTIWIRPLKPLRLLKSLVGAPAPRGIGEAPHPDPIAPPAILGSPDLALFLRRSVRGLARLVTDTHPAYLAWRYGNCPGLCYGATGAFDHTSGALVVFRRTVRREHSELRLCEIFTTEDRPSRNKAGELVRGLLREHDVDLVTARPVPGTAQAVAFARCGFVPVPGLGPVLAVRPLTEGLGPPTIDRLSAWGASIGDLEVF